LDDLAGCWGRKGCIHAIKNSSVLPHLMAEQGERAQRGQHGELGLARSPKDGRESPGVRSTKRVGKLEVADGQCPQFIQDARVQLVEGAEHLVARMEYVQPEVERRSSDITLAGFAHARCLPSSYETCPEMREPAAKRLGRPLVRVHAGINRSAL
jgi:hypothetical protein